MRLLVLMAVVAAVVSADRVASPYQFHKTSGRSFVHGYMYPQYQAPIGASVQGLNVYAHPTIYSHPAFAPRAYAQNPVAPVGEYNVVPAAATFPISAPLVPQQQDLGRSSLSPLLKLAVDAGFVQASGYSQIGSPQYDISPELAEDAGSVSELAYRLGALPVAAVHDVQMRPNMVVQDDHFSPVLIHQDLPKVTKYTLDVPIQ